MVRLQLKFEFSLSFTRTHIHTHTEQLTNRFHNIPLTTLFEVCIMVRVRIVAIWISTIRITSNYPFGSNMFNLLGTWNYTKLQKKKFV